MNYSVYYSDFSNNKHGFFAQSITSINKTKEKAEQHDYLFLTNNQLIIEQEFNQLFKIIKKDKTIKKEFLLYCYYCCLMLEAYYIGYDNTAKIEEYAELKSQLLEQFESDKKPNNQDSFLKTIGNQIYEDLADWATTPLHIYKLKTKVVYLNMLRVYWMLCRLTITNSLILARNAQLIDKLGKLLGKQIDVDKIIKIFEAPNVVLRALSVGFFAARFIMNIAMLVKHTFLPTDQEKALSISKRFKNELWKRHVDLLTDIVWSVVNILCNYPEIFHISATAASWITASFLLFDVSMLLWRRYLVQEEYLIIKSQHAFDLRHYNGKLQRCINELNLLNETNIEKDRVNLIRLIAQFSEQCRVLNEQSIENEINWQTQNSFFLFNTTAAVLLVVGFSASLLFTPALFVIASYALCIFAVAMYLSADSYKQFKDKSLRVTQAHVEGKEEPSYLRKTQPPRGQQHKITIQDPLIRPAGTFSPSLGRRENERRYSEDYVNARNDFIYTLLKNAILPGLVITTVALCWQAAVILTAAYLAYELWRAYANYKQNSASPSEENSEELPEDLADNSLKC